MSGTSTAWIRNGVSNKGPEGLTKAFLNSSYIPALTAYEYRGHIITAWARPEFTNGSTSVGIVYQRARLGSIIQAQRIDGTVRRFDVKPYLDFGVFRELKDLAYFNQVKLAFGTVQWPHEQDFSPDTLYLESILIDESNSTGSAQGNA